MLRIRKLTPLECLKLMGFEKQDYDAIKTMSDSRVYHMAGDSIVVSCLMGLFGQLLPISEEELLQAIREYTDSLANPKEYLDEQAIMRLLKMKGVKK